MDLATALTLQKSISNQFLFSRQKQLAYAGEDDDYGPSSDQDFVYEIFEDIFGVVVAGDQGSGYHLELLSERADILYMTPILEFFRVRPGDIVPVISSPFTLRSRKRPLEIGSSVSHRLNYIKGTLGCFVKDKDGETYILSNHHVLYNSDDYRDNFVVQPCAMEGGSANDVVGEYKESLAYFPSDINSFDAALAGPVQTAIKPKIPGINKAVKGTVKAENGQQVYKIGATTGITYGKISSLSANARVKIDDHKYDFVNQIRIQGFDNQFAIESPFSQPGDSGALILDLKSHKAIGLLFAGNEEGITLANPIQPVLEKLRVSF
jgi:hypothetical protein